MSKEAIEVDIPIVSEMRIITLPGTSGMRLISGNLDEFRSQFSALIPLFNRLNLVKKTQEEAYAKSKQNALRTRALMDSFMDLKHKIESMFGIKNVSNAWLKGWELIHRFGKKIIAEGQSPVRVEHAAELPGSLLLSIKAYLEHHGLVDDWHASSFYDASIPNDTIHLGDSYKLVEQYPDRWVMNGVEVKGDMQSLADIKFQVSAARDRLARIYTADLAIGEHGDLDAYDQEIVNMRAHFGTAIVGLGTLEAADSSVFIIKLFTGYRPFFVSMLAYLSGKFDYSCICKPVTSRPLNSEIYFVGVGYNGISNTELESLYDIFETIPKYGGLFNAEFVRAVSSIPPIVSISDAWATAYIRGMTSMVNTQIAHLIFFKNLFGATLGKKDIDKNYSDAIEKARLIVTTSWQNNNGLIKKSSK